MAEREERICIPFTHTYDQFTTFFYDGRVYLSDTSYPIGQCCVDIVNMDEEVLEPPAFWSVGCLTHKSESFRLRFVLFTTVRSADFPLFPSSPARFFRVLGQKWVRGCNIRRGLASCNLAPQSTLSILIPQMA